MFHMKHSANLFITIELTIAEIFDLKMIKVREF